VAVNFPGILLSPEACVITTSLKLVAASLFGAAGIVALTYGWIGGWLGILLCIGVLLHYARQGGAATAFSAFKRGDIDAVRRAVASTWWPNLLSKQNQAYLNWMEGVVLVADYRFTQAREKLLLAAQGAIQTENDRSLIQCLLAEVSMQLNDWGTASDHYVLAKRLRHHEQVDRMIAAGENRLRARRGFSDDSVNQGKANEKASGEAPSSAFETAAAHFYPDPGIGSRAIAQW